MIASFFSTASNGFPLTWYNEYCISVSVQEMTSSDFLGSVALRKAWSFLMTKFWIKSVKTFNFFAEIYEPVVRALA